MPRKKINFALILSIVDLYQEKTLPIQNSYKQPFGGKKHYSILINHIFRVCKKNKICRFHKKCKKQCRLKYAQIIMQWWLFKKYIISEIDD